MGENIYKQSNQQGINLQIIQTAMQLNIKITNKPIKKRAEDVNRHFSKEDLRMANKHMKTYSTSLTIREMQIKITMRCHFTPFRMAIIKNIY